MRKIMFDISKSDELCQSTELRNISILMQYKYKENTSKTWQSQIFETKDKKKILKIAREKTNTLQEQQ